MARPRSDIAPRLLRAARARFLRDGVDGASLRDIARAARTSLGMIHYYFPTKDDVFLGVVEEVYRGFSDDITAIVSAAGPFEERVRALYRRIAVASEHEIDVLRLIVREVLVSSSRRRLIMARFLGGHVPPVLAALFAAQQGGEIDPERPLPAVAMALLATAIFPQVIRRVVRDDRTPLPLPPPEELAAALATFFLAGVSRR